MKLISWNVNGLRACMNKGLHVFFSQVQADIFSIQETKMSREQADFHFDGYEEYWNSAEKKGYSGTAVFSKAVPLNVSYGIGLEEHSHEGRVITAEFEQFYLVNCYTPNSQRGLERIGYRMAWDRHGSAYLMALDSKKPVILCGDLNVAHQEIDLKNPKNNHQNAGFSDEERQKMTQLLSSGFTDSFRYLHPDTTGVYTWWSYMFNARVNNAGWRIDYFIVSDRIRDRIKSAEIYTDVFGSDHCPIGLQIDL